MSGCASARLGNTDLIGTASFACGFTDGPATLAHLQVEGDPSTWWIFNVQGAAPEQLDGEFAINNGVGDGATSLRVCDNALNCTSAVEGTLVAHGHRRVVGSLEYRLPGHALERRTYSARVEKSDLVCP